MKKRLISIIALALMCCCLIGTTYAWLVSKSAPVTNTFTSGNVNISLADTASRNRILIPGATLMDDTKAIVRANSEDCWLFIKIDKSELFDSYITLTVEEGWIPLNGSTDIYYRAVSSSAEDQTFFVPKDNEITVRSDRSIADYANLNSSNYPTVRFTAYAVQKLGFSTAEAAWAEAEKLG